MIVKLVVAALLAAISVTPLLAATTVIHAGHLIAEPGKPATANQSIIIENGKIVAIKEGFVAWDPAIDLKDSWVMPGLTDMHTHVRGIEKLDAPVGGQLTLFYMSRPAEAVLTA